MSPEQRLENDRKRAASTRAASSGSSRIHIAIVGLSAEGLGLAELAAERGFRVQAFDSDEVKVAQLAEHERDALTISADPRALARSDAFLICAPAPIVNGMMDYGFLKDACKQVGAALSEGALVCIETPVEIGVCERVCLPVLEKHSGLSRHQFHFAHAPARELSPDGAWHLDNTPRLVGALSREAQERALSLYDTLLSAEVHTMQSIQEAEAAATLERAFYDVNRALVNEMAIALQDAEIDITRVIDGAATKPFGFLAHPSGFIEARSTADPYRALRRDRKGGYEHRFLAAAEKANRALPAYVVHMLTKALEEKRRRMKQVSIALLGFGETQDSDAARTVAESLTKKGARIRLYDPASPALSTVRSLDEALHGADAAVILANGPAFSAIDAAELLRHGVGIVIDGLNCLDNVAIEEAGIIYHGLGR